MGVFFRDPRRLGSFTVLVFHDMSLVCYNSSTSITMWVSNSLTTRGPTRQTFSEKPPGLTSQVCQWIGHATGADEGTPVVRTVPGPLPVPTPGTRMRFRKPAFS